MEYDLGKGSASRSDCPFLPRCKCPPPRRLLLFYLLAGFLAVVALLLILLIVMVLHAFILVQHPIDKPIWNRVDRENISLSSTMRNRLIEAVKIQTVSTGYRQYNVGALDGFHEHLQRAFPKIHGSRFIHFEKVQTYSLLYTIQGSDQTLDPYILCAHMDVVPAEEKDSNQKRLWKVHPFSGKHMDDAVWGRGTLDDKASLMGIMEALEYLLRRGRQPTRGFYLAFSHDQEVNGDGASEMVRILRRRTIRALFVIDEGSRVLKGYLPGTDKQVGVIAVTEKGNLDLKVTTKAKGGSTSVPSTEISAIGRLSQAIYYIENNIFPSHLQNSTTKKMLEYLAPHMDFGSRLVMSNLWLLWPVVSLFLSSDATTNAQIRTTTAITQIYGGRKLNVLPQEAYAYLNLRIMPGDTSEGVLEAIKSAVGDPEVDYEVFGRPSDAPEESFFSEHAFGYQLLKSNIHNFFPDTLVIPGMTLGATDARHYHSISNQVYRFLPLVRDRSKPPLMHSNDERITDEEYERMINFYYQLMRSADSTHLPIYTD